MFAVTVSVRANLSFNAVYSGHSAYIHLLGDADMNSQA